MARTTKLSETAWRMCCTRTPSPTSRARTSSRNGGRCPDSSASLLPITSRARQHAHAALPQQARLLSAGRHKRRHGCLMVRTDSRDHQLFCRTYSQTLLYPRPRAAPIRDRMGGSPEFGAAILRCCPGGGRAGARLEGDHDAAMVGVAVAGGGQQRLPVQGGWSGRCRRPGPRRRARPAAPRPAAHTCARLQAPSAVRQPTRCVFAWRLDMLAPVYKHRLWGQPGAVPSATRPASPSPGHGCGRITLRRSAWRWAAMLAS